MKNNSFKSTFVYTIILAVVIAIIFVFSYFYKNTVILCNDVIKDIEINGYSVIKESEGINTVVSCRDNSCEHYELDDEIEKISYKDLDNKLITIYEAKTLNTEYSNFIKIKTNDNNQRIFERKIKNLSKDNFIDVYSFKDKKLYRVRTLPKAFPDLKLEKKGEYIPGYIFTTISIPPMLYSENNEHSIFDERYLSFALCYNSEKSKLVFYAKANNRLTNFQKHITNDDKIRFSYNEEEIRTEFCPICHSKVILLDENFQFIKTIYSKEYNYINPHFLKLFNDNHYVISSVLHGKQYIKQFEKEMDYRKDILQEIEDGKLIFKLDFSKYTDFLEKYNLWNNKDRMYIDHVHINSLMIDPSDNNYILSLGTVGSIVKLDRKTGNIIWILGGLGDMFGLTPSQQMVMQHSISFTHDGYLLLLNNNTRFWFNDPDPNHADTKIALFKIDEKNKKLEDYKEYKVDKYIQFQGSVQEIAPDRYLIAYGIELNPDGFLFKQVDINNPNNYIILKCLNNNLLESYNALQYKSLK